VTVGFFSPLPPARTGVAEYSAALIAALSKHCEVRVGDSGAGVCLYHVGNNPLHAEIYRQALERPGVVVLHDAVLHHLLLGCLDRQAYIAEFVYNYGEFERGLAAELWDGRSRSALDPRYFERALVRRIAEVSRAVVVHNPAAARIVREHAPGARVVEIPHLFVAGPPRGTEERLDTNVEAAGRSACATKTEFLFGVFGHLRGSKRIPAILRAFDRVRSSGAAARLLVAGDFVSTELESALAPMLAAPGVTRMPYLPEAEFQTLAADVDACINLRSPSAGETSGIAIRLMGIAKPVLVSAGEEVARFPENAVIRIDRGLAEEPQLVDYMMWLVQHPERARQIGARAAATIAAYHAPDLVALRYFELLSSCCR
jgi:glycosyltransferase involved in cell wall biosynthesis